MLWRWNWFRWENILLYFLPNEYFNIYNCKVNTNSLERQKREKTEREKVRVLENLKGQAVTLQETGSRFYLASIYTKVFLTLFQVEKRDNLKWKKQIDGQRAQLGENIVMLGGNNDGKTKLLSCLIVNYLLEAPVHLIKYSITNNPLQIRLDEVHLVDAEIYKQKEMLQQVSLGLLYNYHGLLSITEHTFIGRW